MGFEVALQVYVHVRRVLLVHLVLFGMLRGDGLGGGRAGGVKKGVGIEGVEQRVQVRVGLQESAFTFLLVGWQFREAQVDGVVCLDGNFALCLMLSMVVIVAGWRNIYSRRPASRLTMSRACRR